MEGRGREGALALGGKGMSLCDSWSRYGVMHLRVGE